MVIKINYTSSDVYVSTSVSPVYVVVNYSGANTGGGVWGQITGTLSNQTDLQNALDAKFDDPTGTTAQYLRGDGSLATFPTIPSGTVTSVGLTMPSAFSVANSPITSSGTLAVTGAGTSAQYVRGDGQLANFPTNGGGGSSVNYYLNGSVTQGTFGGDTYYEMSKTPVLGAGTDFTRTNAQGNGYIASFITDAGDPSLLNIPGGNWNLEFYFQSSASGGSPQFYGEVYKVDASNNFTLVASGSTNPEGITNGTTVDQYFTSIPVPQTSLLVTDRLAIRIYVITSGRTITLHTEDGNLCEVLTTFSTGLNALNGLTAQVQYFATGTSGTDFAISSATDTHTFNLPTASATNRGALSSADWSTFNSKPNGNIYTADGTLSADRTVTSGGFGLTILGGKEIIATVQTGLELKTSTTGKQLSLYLTNTNTTTGRTYELRSDTDGAFRLVQPGVATFFSRTSGGQITLGNTTASGAANQTFNIHTVNTGVLQVTGAGGTLAGAALDLFYTSGISYLRSYNNTSGSWLEMELHSSNTKFRNSGSYTGQIFSATGNWLIQTGGTFTDSGQRLQVQGNAIISTTSQLTAISSTGGLFISNSTTSANGVIGLTGAGFILQGKDGASTSYPLLLQPYGSNVGIGTSSPSYKLDVQGTVGTVAIRAASNTAGDILYYATGSVTGSTDAFRTAINATGNVAAFLANTNSATGSSVLDISVPSASTGDPYLSFTTSGATNWSIGIDNSDSDKFKIGPVSNPSNSSTAIVAHTTGNISLNSATDAGFKLDVNGTARVSGAVNLATSSGNVGIGVTGGVLKLDVQGNAADTTTVGGVTVEQVTLFRPSNGVGGIRSGFNTTTGHAYIWSSTSGGNLNFGTRSAPDNNVGMTLTFGGNLLVGTTTDAGEKFQVNGSARVGGSSASAQLYLKGGVGNGQYLYFDDGGSNLWTIVGASIFAIDSSSTRIFRANANAQVTINGSSVNATAQLQVDSTTRGFLPPRLTTTQKNAIGTPAAGLIVYDTDTNKLCCYNGSTWNDLF